MFPCQAIGRGGTQGADDQGVQLAGDVAREHAHDLPAAAAGDGALGGERAGARAWAIAHTALLAARRPEAAQAGAVRSE